MHTVLNKQQADIFHTDRETSILPKNRQGTVYVYV